MIEDNPNASNGNVASDFVFADGVAVAEGVEAADGVEAPDVLNQISNAK